MTGTPPGPFAPDARLQAILDSFPPCPVGADIGADHGRLSLLLLLRGRCQRMIVSDISAASLSRARALLARHGLSDRAVFSVADGFEALTEPVGAVAVCGLGGKSIAAMLDARDRLGEARLVLSPHGAAWELRAALAKAGYRIPRELVLRSFGRFYTVMTAEKGQAVYSEGELYVGLTLEGTDSASVADYLGWRLSVARRERGPEAAKRVAWLEEALWHETGKGTGSIRLA